MYAKAELLKAGPLSIVVDAGREGYQHLGVTPGGASDTHAYAWANKLLGNRFGSSCIEISFGGLEVQFEQATMISLCGAALPLLINKVAQPAWQSHQIEAGDIIEIKPGRVGNFAYLAVLGGWQFDQILGSSSSCLSQNLFAGEQPLLQNGQILAYQKLSELKRSPPRLASVPRSFVPDYQTELKLGLIPSYQWRHFSAQDQELLLKQAYHLEQNSNRVGVRLQGQEKLQGTQAIRSEGISYGSVQVPPNGQPIILLSEHQTIGGYPKLGCVARLDCYQLAQRKPGDKVSFGLSSLATQRQALAEFQAFFANQ